MTSTHFWKPAKFYFRLILVVCKAAPKIFMFYLVCTVETVELSLNPKKKKKSW